MKGSGLAIFIAVVALIAAFIAICIAVSNSIGTNALGREESGVTLPESRELIGFNRQAPGPQPT